MEKSLSFFKGRIMLIKAMLSVLPLHYMSLFKMPDATIDRLDRIRRNFLWEGDSDKKKKKKRKGFI